MTTLSEGNQQYRLTVRGECAALLGSIPGVAEVEGCASGHTSVMVCVCDDSALWGLLDRLQDLALHIVSLHELGGASRAADGRSGLAPAAQ
jgi:hypothetical protein